MKDATNADAANNNVVTPHLVTLDQSIICFDVEQVSDAKQKVVIGRFEGIDNKVAWRIRTNAPTRYIVNPNSGVLDETNPTQSITIELVGNRYNPHHKLVVQAIELLETESPKTIWKSQRAKEQQQQNVEVINLELSTTLMNLEYTQRMSNDRAGQTSAIVTTLLEQSTTSGQERIKELEGLYQMLKADSEKIQKNVDRTSKLKEVLESHLEARKQTIKELNGKIEESENRIGQLHAKIKSQETALVEVRNRKKSDDKEGCGIM